MFNYEDFMIESPKKMCTCWCKSSNIELDLLQVKHLAIKLKHLAIKF